VGVITALGLVVLGPEGLKVPLIVKLKLLDTHAVAELVLIEDPVTQTVGVYVGEPKVFVEVNKPDLLIDKVVVLEIDTVVVYVGVPGVLVAVNKDDTVRLGISVGVMVTLCVIEIVFEILVVGELERIELPVTQTVGV
jgi:hypothetical protein